MALLRLQINVINRFK